VNTQDAQRLAELRRLCVSGEARRIREASGLSQPEVAGVVGVVPSAISRWERGERRPSGRPALAYARLLEAVRHEP